MILKSGLETGKRWSYDWEWSNKLFISMGRMSTGFFVWTVAIGRRRKISIGFEILFTGKAFSIDLWNRDKKYQHMWRLWSDKKWRKRP